jgi:uncharacterized spore protein YtfJ
MELKEILSQARETLSVSRVFGEPIERDGVVVVPVAILRGGAGGGSGERQTDEQRPGGLGGGWGTIARPAGVYVISGNDVRWQPAVDVNRAIIGGQIVAIVALLVLRSVLKARRRRA